MQIADSYQSRRQIVNIQLCAVISNFSSDHPTPHEVSLASSQASQVPKPSTISDSENETRRKTFEHWLVATNGQTKQLVGNESEIDREIEIFGRYLFSSRCVSLRWLESGVFSNHLQSSRELFKMLPHCHFVCIPPQYNFFRPHNCKLPFLKLLHHGNRGKQLLLGHEASLWLLLKLRICATLKNCKNGGCIISGSFTVTQLIKWQREVFQLLICKNLGSDQQKDKEH